MLMMTEKRKIPRCIVSLLNWPQVALAAKTKRNDGQRFESYLSEQFWWLRGSHSSGSVWAWHRCPPGWSQPPAGPGSLGQRLLQRKCHLEAKYNNWLVKWQITVTFFSDVVPNGNGCSCSVHPGDSQTKIEQQHEPPLVGFEMTNYHF